MPPDDAVDPARLESLDFELVRRGFDPTTVRAALHSAAREIRRLNLERDELAGRLDEYAGAPSEQLEPHRVAEALGVEATQVLEAAHLAASERAERAEREAEAVREEARVAAETMRTEAQETADNTRAQAQKARDEMLEEARREAETIVEEGRTRGREMVTEAQTVRERMLRDLARKRQAGRAQVEQLRAGRDRLLETLSTTQGSLQAAVDDLVNSVPEARAAAERAGLRVTAETTPSPEDLEGEIESARAVGHPLVDDLPDAGSVDADAFNDDEMDALDLIDGSADETASAAAAEETGEAEAAEAASSEEDDEEGGDAGGVVPEDPPEGAVEAPASDLDDITDLDEPDAPVLYDVEAEEDDDEGPPAEVDASDELFARLRSSQGGSAAEMVLGAADDAAAAVREQERADDELDEEPAPDDGEPEPEDEETEADPRTVALEAAATAAAKAMKKVLVEEQGTLLDGIRRSGADAVAFLINDAAGHEKPYDKAATPALKDLAAALGGTRRLDLKPALHHVHAIALEPVRQRLADVAERIDDPDELSDTVRALYRESRTRRLPEAAAAAATAVDGLVVIATATGKVRWSVDDDGPCGPDCADNALAGALDAGAEFPTGDRHPPAHPTCTCRLLAADDAD